MELQSLNLRSINARILNTEKRYGKDSQIVKRIYDTINKAYKSEGMTRFRTKDVSFREFTTISQAYDIIYNSAYTSKEGRAKLQLKIKESFKVNHLKWNDREIEMIQDFFKNNVAWDKIRELVGQAYSGQVVENIKNSLNNNEEKEVDNLMSSLLNGDISISEFNDSLMDISTRGFEYEEEDLSEF